MTQITWKPTGKTRSGAFTTADDWLGGVLPGAWDTAVLGGLGAAYTVTFAPQAGYAGEIAALFMVPAATLAVTWGTLTVTNQLAGSGTVNVSGGAALQLGGGPFESFTAAMANAGQVALAGGASAGASLLFDAGQASLGGGGAIVMTGSEADVIGAASGAEVNLIVGSQTLEGAGTIGGAGMSLYFGAGAVVNANANAAANAANDQTLTLAGNSVIVNRGLLTATNDGALMLQGSVDNDGVIRAFTQPVASGASTQTESITLSGDQISGGGRVAANGAGASVIMDGASIWETAATVNGGRLIAASGTNTIVAATISDNGQIDVAANAKLAMAGDLAGSGRLILKGDGGAAELLAMGGELELSGQGVIQLGDSQSGIANTIAGSGAASELYNVDDLIVGSGTVGDGELRIVNGAGGSIVSNGAGMTLIGGAGGAAPSTNQGAISAANNANLTVEGGWIGGGKFTANAGSTITLDNASLVGGSLNVQSGGFVKAAATSVDLLSDTISNSGTLTAVDDTLALGGAVVNHASMIFDAGAGQSDWLKFDSSTGATSFTGGGTVEFEGAGNDYVGSGGGAQLWSNVDDIISGTADLDDALMTLSNGRQGAIDADGGAGRTFTIHTGANAVGNNGLIEATNGSDLRLMSAVTGTGTVEVGAGSTVELGSTWTNAIDFSAPTGASPATQTLVIDASQAESLLPQSSSSGPIPGEIYGFDGASQQIEIGDILGSTALFVGQEHRYGNGQPFTDVTINVGGSENSNNTFTGGASFNLVLGGWFGGGGQPTLTFGASTDGHLMIYYHPAGAG